MTNKTMLIILDGWGKGSKPEADAIHQADTPFIDSLYTKYPNAELITYGEEVGLPEGQMGNSEVGHLNLGAGRIVYQDLAKINKSIRDGEFLDHPVLNEAFEKAVKNGKKVHLMGLLSDGGVHSHINHVKALSDLAEKYNTTTYIHAFMDGRDTDPQGGVDYLNDLLNHLKNHEKTRLASIIGRYYAMDRDNRWERIKLAYDLLVHGKGELTCDPTTLLQSRYNDGETDEFIKPIVMQQPDGYPNSVIEEGDSVIFFNFRTDRPRQLTIALTQKDMPEEGMQTIPLHYATMTQYNEEFEGLHVAYEKEAPRNTIGEVLSKAGKTQTRIAETEKYPHVTFFFNGGKEQPFDSENRILVPSPKVATYDLQPEMSAAEVTDKIIADLKNNQPDFVCLNFANTDMVGHTGDFEAAKKSATTVDNCVRQIMEVALPLQYETLIIADHGNSDFMINKDGSPHTAHTTNPVPCILVSEKRKDATIKAGKLGDIAPTLLYLMGVDIPEEMTGEVLV